MVSPRFLRAANRMLGPTQWLLVVALAGVGWRIVTRDSPGAVADRDLPKSASSADPQTTLDNELPPLAEYAVIWQRDLQQPPILPPVNTEEPKQPRKPPAPLPKLLGTFLEDSGAWAHLVAQNGKARVFKTGDVIDSYALVAIEPGRVQLQNGRRVHWIEVPKPKSLITEHR